MENAMDGRVFVWGTFLICTGKKVPYYAREKGFLSIEVG